MGVGLEPPTWETGKVPGFWSSLNHSKFRRMAWACVLRLPFLGYELPKNDREKLFRVRPLFIHRRLLWRFCAALESLVNF